MSQQDDTGNGREPGKPSTQHSGTGSSTKTSLYRHWPIRCYPPRSNACTILWTCKYVLVFFYYYICTYQHYPTQNPTSTSPRRVRGNKYQDSVFFFLNLCSLDNWKTEVVYQLNKTLIGWDGLIIEYQ